MATQLTDEELFSTLDAEQNYQTLTEAAQSLGLTRKGFSYRLEVARDRLGHVPDYGETIGGYTLFGGSVLLLAITGNALSGLRRKPMPLIQ